MKALSIRHLTKIYNNGFEALKGIDLDVEEDRLADRLPDEVKTYKAA